MSLYQFMKNLGTVQGSILHADNHAITKSEKKACAQVIKKGKQEINVADMIYDLMFDFDKQYRTWFKINHKYDTAYQVFGKSELLHSLIVHCKTYMKRYMFVKSELEKIKGQNQYIYQLYSPLFKLKTNDFVGLFLDDCVLLAERHNFSIEPELKKQLVYELKNKDA